MEMSSQSIKSYVISLETAQQRREHITREFSDKGITFEFFDAISPFNGMQDITKELIPALEENNTLSNGEKGCLLSHLALWKRCVDEHLDYVAIFEDDVLLSADIHKFTSDISWLENNFAKHIPLAVRFETYKMPVRLCSNNIVILSDRKLNRLKSAHWGTAGYVINREMAVNLLSFFKEVSEDCLLAVDQVMFELFLENKEVLIYQFSPALCIQEIRMFKNNSKLLSNIERTNKRRPQVNSIFDKVKREFYRVKRKINYKLNDFSVVPFK